MVGSLLFPAHLLAVLPLQMQVVSGIHASVHALLIPGDSALHPDTLGCRPQRKLLKVIHVNGGLVDWRRGRRGYLLWVIRKKKKQPVKGGTPSREAVTVSDVRC